MTNIKCTIVFSVCWVLGNTMGWADEINLGTAVVNKETYLNALDPETDAAQEPEELPPGKVRGISMEPVHKAIRKSGKAANGVNLQVFFEYKSSELSDQAKRQLDPLGEALASSRLQTLDFTIEGHTDSRGGVAYNQELSEQRASAVKSYLVEKFGIDSVRISAVGKGKSSPFDPDHPDRAVNRRVRVAVRH